MASGAVGTENSVANGISSLANIPSAINALQQQKFGNDLQSSNLALQQIASARQTQGQNFAEQQARASQAIAAFNNYLNLSANDNGQTANAVSAALSSNGDPTKALSTLPPSVLQSASRAIGLLKATGADKDLPPQYSALFGTAQSPNGTKDAILAIEQQQEDARIANDKGGSSGALGTPFKAAISSLGDLAGNAKDYLFGQPSNATTQQYLDSLNVQRAQNALTQLNRQRVLGNIVPGIAPAPLNLQNGTLVPQPQSPTNP